jgi:hypothetical protein
VAGYYDLWADEIKRSLEAKLPHKPVLIIDPVV